MRTLIVAIAVAGACGLMAGCAFEGPGTDGTSFACVAPDNACPGGFVCLEGRCVRGVGPDSGSDPGADAPKPPDGQDPPTPPPDGPIDSAQIRIFGDNPLADVKGTAADTKIVSGNVNGDPQEDIEFGSAFDLDADTQPLTFSLMRFDLTAIPQGSTIEKAEMVVFVVDVISEGEFEAQRVLTSWSEANANFNRADVNKNWPSPGGGSAIENSVVASFAPRDIDTAYTIVLDTATVQGWVDEPSKNFGVRWRSNSTTNQGGEWVSRDAPNGSRRPYLRVTFR